MDDAEVLALVGPPDPGSSAAPQSTTVRVGRDRVFVKRLPLTERERARPGCTANLFQLPLYYHYGVGSLGFGIERELTAHEEATRWVLDGAIEGLPLMLARRTVPRPRPAPLAADEVARYREYWNGSARVARLLSEKAAAEHEVLVFLEHFEHTAAPWLERHPERLEGLLDQVRGTLRALQRRGVVHFDAHAHNIVTDGRLAVLTDFGLWLDRDFELAPGERAFLAAHRRYDEGELALNVAPWLVGLLERGGARRRRAALEHLGVEPSDRWALRRALVADVETLADRGWLPLSSRQVELVRAYRPVVEQMLTFFEAMRRGSDKKASLDHDGLVRGLARARRHAPR